MSIGFCFSFYSGAFKTRTRDERHVPDIQQRYQILLKMQFSEHYKNFNFFSFKLKIISKIPEFSKNGFSVKIRSENVPKTITRAQMTKE